MSLVYVLYLNLVVPLELTAVQVNKQSSPGHRGYTYNYLSFYLYFYPPITFYFIFETTHLSIHLSNHLSICLSTYLFIFQKGGQSGTALAKIGLKICAWKNMLFKTDKFMKQKNLLSNELFHDFKIKTCGLCLRAPNYKHKCPIIYNQSESLL